MSPIYCHDRAVGYVSIGCLSPDSNVLNRRFRSICQRYGFSEDRLRSSYSLYVHPTDPPHALAGRRGYAGTIVIMPFRRCSIGRFGIKRPDTRQIILQRAMEYLHHPIHAPHSQWMILLYSVSTPNPIFNTYFVSNMAPLSRPIWKPCAWKRPGLFYRTPSFRFSKSPAVSAIGIRTILLPSFPSLTVPPLLRSVNAHNEYKTFSYAST